MASAANSPYLIRDFATSGRGACRWPQCPCSSAARSGFSYAPFSTPSARTTAPVGPVKAWRSITVTTLGGFVLGTMTGAVWLATPGDNISTTAGVGLSAALMTFCVSNGATATLFREGLTWRTALLALTYALLGFAAGAVGVALGIELVS